MTPRPPTRKPIADAEPVAVTQPLALQLRGIGKRYGTQVALQGLDMQVHEGEVYGFLGRNGAGKVDGASDRHGHHARLPRRGLALR